MADYKAMYYYLAGRMATAVDALDATTGALVEISEKIKNAQRSTEEMFMNSEETVISIIENKLHKNKEDKE